MNPNPTNLRRKLTLVKGPLLSLAAKIGVLCVIFSNCDVIILTLIVTLTLTQAFLSGKLMPELMYFWNVAEVFFYPLARRAAICQLFPLLCHLGHPYNLRLNLAT